MKLTTQGIFLNVDSCTKFVNQVSIYKQLQEDISNGYSEKDFFEKFNSSNIDNKRITVITSHNSKSY